MSAQKKENSLNIIPYIPGDLTSPRHRHHTYENLVSDLITKKEEIRTSEKGYPKYREDFTKPIPKEKKDLKQQTEEMYEQHRLMMSQNCHCTERSHHCHKKKSSKHDDPSEPFRAAAKNFQLAKKLHKENLEHEPLPDTITEALYRKFQMQKDCREPGLLLKDGNYATGVGWKGYPGYGATRCTKLKVYRPKTGIAENSGHKCERPLSVSSFDKKWRFIRRDKVTPIELAICWDVTPKNPLDEPKRPTHIDGSNGSRAPGIFSLVHSPKPEINFEKKEVMREEICNCSSVSSNGEQIRAKTALKKFNKSSTDSSSCSTLKRAQSAYNVRSESKTSTDKTAFKIVKKEFYQSTPMLSEYQSSYKYCSKECKKKNRPNSRLCVACELKNVEIKDKRPKSEFKMAFKAGVPQKSRVSNESLAGFKLSRIPKPKVPYRERKYEINSLAPPFSLQNGRRDDYPEHWRLASVYQHSYKPVHTRKRPLLETVYQ